MVVKQRTEKAALMMLVMNIHLLLMGLLMSLNEKELKVLVMNDPLSLKGFLHFARPFLSLQDCVSLAPDCPGSGLAHFLVVASFSRGPLPLLWPIKQEGI